MAFAADHGDAQGDGFGVDVDHQRIKARTLSEVIAGAIAVRRDIRRVALAADVNDQATAATKISAQMFDMRHIAHRPLCTDQHKIKPGLRDGKWLAPCRGDDVMRRLSAAPARGVVTPSCYRLRVCTSMVTTTATRTKTTTRASASKDPIALMSVRPANFPNVNSSEGRSRATNRTGGHYCALPPPRISDDGHHHGIEVEGDAVLDARRMRKQRRPATTTTPHRFRGSSGEHR